MTEYIERIDKIIQTSTPTKIIKRGNAFALVEVVNEFEIEDSLTRIEFDGINIINVSRNPNYKFTGEYYILEDSFREEEYELTVEIASSSDVLNFENLKINEYELNIAQKELYLSIQEKN